MGKYKQVVMVSDPEGNLDYFLKALMPFEDDFIVNQNLTSYQDSDTLHVSLGDMVDKGNGDLRILKTIQDDLKNRTRNWLLIAGNRDDNKLALFSALVSKNYINNFLFQDQKPFWDNQAKSPVDFYITDILKVEKEDNYLTKYAKLTFEEKRVVVAKWRLAWTMGAPKKFEFRRDELAIILKRDKSNISDDMVVQSFIEEMLSSQDEIAPLVEKGLMSGELVLPTDYFGLMRDYIDSSVPMALVDGILYAHSGLTHHYQASNVQDYVHQQCDKRRENIVNFLGALKKEIEQDGNINMSRHPAIMSSLPQSDESSLRCQNVTSVNTLENPVPTQVLDQLLPEVKGFFHGHQPTMTNSIYFKRYNGMILANLDTSLIQPGFYQHPTQTRLYLSEDNTPRLISLSEKDGVVCLLDSSDPILGETIAIDDKPYVITGKLTPYDNYRCVYYEKKLDQKFFTVNIVSRAFPDETDLEEATFLQVEKDINSQTKIEVHSSMITRLSEMNPYAFFFMSLAVGATTAAVIVSPLLLLAVIPTTTAIITAASVTVGVTGLALAARFFAVNNQRQDNDIDSNEDDKVPSWNSSDPN